VGKRVKQVYANDRDAADNGKVEYFITEDPSGFFTINHYTGWVSVLRPMAGVSVFVLCSLYYGTFSKVFV